MKRVILLLVLSLNLYAQDNNEKKRQKYLRLLDEQFKEINQLSGESEHKNPILLLRLANILLDKARILKESELEKLLTLPPEDRDRKRKDAHTESTNHIRKSLELCNAVVKSPSFPRFKDKADVYLIIANINKEMGNTELANKYLKLAVNDKDGNEESKRKSKLSLAEINFNNQQFDDSATLYESARRSTDQWWTKDSFNLAQCYFMQKKYSKALELMLEVHTKSKEDRYINFAPQVENEIAKYFIEAGKKDEAVDFYKKLGKNISKQFLKIALHLVDKREYTRADKMLIEALNNEPDLATKKEIYFAVLKLDKQFDRTANMLKLSTELVNLYEQGQLSKQEADILYHNYVDFMSKTLLKRIADGTYKSSPDLQKKKTEESVAFGLLASRLDQKDKSQSLYIVAETNFAGAQFIEAFSNYEKAYDHAKIAKNTKVMKDSVDGMLKCIEKAKGKLDKQNKGAFIKALEIDPSANRSDEIFQRLFNIYNAENNVEDCERVLASYHKYFPAKSAEQEVMLEKILAHHTESKNFDSYNKWVSKIKTGEFKVSDKFKQALVTNTASLQLGTARKLDEGGDKQKAAQAYIAVFNNPDSTKESKDAASFNLALIYNQFSMRKEYYHWAVENLKIMPIEKSKDRVDAYDKFSSDLFYGQEFVASSDLSIRALDKYCSSGVKQNLFFFRNAFFSYMADNKFDEAIKICAKAEKCGIEKQVVNDVKFAVLNELMKDKKWNNATFLINDLGKDSSNYPILIGYLEDLKEAYRGVGNSSVVETINQKMKVYFDYCNKNKLQVSDESRSVLAAPYILQIEGQIKEYVKTQLTFPIEQFVGVMKKRSAIIASINQIFEKVKDTGSGRGIVKAGKLKIDLEQRFIKEVREFTPSGDKIDANYKVAFKKDMEKQTAALLKETLQDIAEIKDVIKKEQILSPDSAWFFADKRINIDLEYKYHRGAVTMDKGGNQ